MTSQQPPECGCGCYCRDRWTPRQGCDRRPVPTRERLLDVRIRSALVSAPATSPPQAVVAESPDDADLRVAPTRHPWRWVVAVAALVLVAQFVHGLVVNPGWDWATFAQYFTAPSVLSALWTTIELTIWGTVLGFGIGVLLA